MPSNFVSWDKSNTALPFLISYCLIGTYAKGKFKSVNLNLKSNLNLGREAAHQDSDVIFLFQELVSMI